MAGEHLRDLTFSSDMRALFGTSQIRLRVLRLSGDVVTVV